jgi:hypothetical protein
MESARDGFTPNIPGRLRLLVGARGQPGVSPVKFLV